MSNIQHTYIEYQHYHEQKVKGMEVLLLSIGLEEERKEEGREDHY
ncbi:MAG: hypothetical protein ACTSUE_19020 [Promethearchaeota archaeon]